MEKINHIPIDTNVYFDIEKEQTGATYSKQYISVINLFLDLEYKVKDFQNRFLINNENTDFHYLMLNEFIYDMNLMKLEYYAKILNSNSMMLQDITLSLLLELEDRIQAHMEYFSNMDSFHEMYDDFVYHVAVHILSKAHELLLDKNNRTILKKHIGISRG